MPVNGRVENGGGNTAAAAITEPAATLPTRGVSEAFERVPEAMSLTVVLIHCVELLEEPGAFVLEPSTEFVVDVGSGAGVTD